jgi:2-oxoglutarate dehydrogenase E2 component (dihydrolipoamide succinyltransferase)
LRFREIDIAIAPPHFYFPMPQRHELILPDLGAGGMPVTASLWLVDVGSEVSEGDRLLEVLFGGAAIDLPAPASGVLAETLVAEDDELSAGQVLGVIVASETKFL